MSLGWPTASDMRLMSYPCHSCGAEPSERCRRWSGAYERYVDINDFHSSRHGQDRNDWLATRGDR